MLILIMLSLQYRYTVCLYYMLTYSITFNLSVHIYNINILRRLPICATVNDAFTLTGIRSQVNRELDAYKFLFGLITRLINYILICD